MPLSPTVLWAQRADRLLLTIDLQNCKDPQIRCAGQLAAPAAPLPPASKWCAASTTALQQCSSMHGADVAAPHSPRLIA